MDGRGQETVKRRAATQAEMESILSVAGFYAVAYLAAVTMGLRRGELSKWNGANIVSKRRLHSAG